ncbi:hypothetical protein DYBT9623_04406 [Dyadobacter sp. CECT 9623]|uniref:Transcriptional regulator n=1 Tax=Dyadobacter linearis TaxID=2823330 RepID=A0ABM8UVQ4_9BACT|nr:hypothetical protein [Dyadobacter sp. CECT 9623]CAG5072866.1 hypothetical protein DYBT9623_04406 [Dyadobacter sp. CECT 9623]
MILVTNELKDQIIEHILQTSNGDMFQIKNSDAEKLFGIPGGKLYSFLMELKDLQYLREVKGYKSGVVGFTTTALDSFYVDGGFVKHFSIKNLLENKVMYEVNRILEVGEKADKSEILGKVEKLRPYIDTAINLANAAVTVKSFLSGGSGSGGHG